MWGGASCGNGESFTAPAAMSSTSPPAMLDSGILIDCLLFLSSPTLNWKALLFLRMFACFKMNGVP